MKATSAACRVRGNIGVRVVNTRVTSKGLRSDLIIVPDPSGNGSFTLDETGDFVTETIKSSNTRILPSVNAIFEVAPNTLVRLAGYRAMSRPNPSALGAGRTITLEGGEEFSDADAIDNIRAMAARA